jgi:RNA polymerase sigma-70 factor (ECF subfamily)
MEPSDRELMAGLARGDGEALEPLMARHYRRVYRIALAYLRDTEAAMDAAQEVFVKVYQNAGRWDPGSEVGPWLTRIVVNHAIDRYRQGRRRLASEQPLPEERSDRDPRLRLDAPSPERQLLGRELGERIGAALAVLPDKQRAVFVLRHYQELSLEEIASALGLSLGTVKSSLHRAIQRLRGELGGLRA